MSSTPVRQSTGGAAEAAGVLNALPHPVITIDPDGAIITANDAAEHFFQASVGFMRRQKLDYFVPFGSPLLDLLDQVRERQAPVSEYRVDLESPRLPGDRIVDIYASPMAEIGRAHV